VAVLGELAEVALALREEVEVYLVDEIGKMECLAPRFVGAMRRLLDSPKPVVATVAERGGGLIAEVKRRKDAELFTLTRANRDELPGRVLAWLARAPVGSPCAS
jgi:nucleoside-triphosphatase